MAQRRRGADRSARLGKLRLACAVGLCDAEERARRIAHSSPTMDCLSLQKAATNPPYIYPDHAAACVVHYAPYPSSKLLQAAAAQPQSSYKHPFYCSVPPHTTTSQTLPHPPTHSSLTTPPQEANTPLRNRLDVAAICGDVAASSTTALAIAHLELYATPSQLV
jgi:hypothetical protein